MTYYDTLANLKGPQGIGIPGPQGLPGVNGVANDAAMAALVNDATSATNQAFYARGVTVADANSINLPVSFTAGLCGVAGDKLTVPTHVTPSGGETTHPSVVLFPKPWNGYRYWMAHTPYAAGDTAQEDPNIVASNDGITWVVPAGLTNPIQDAPGGSDYNSDTDLVAGPDGALWLFWRRVTTVETVYLSKSTNGTTWSSPVAILQTAITPLPHLLSPSLVREADHWTMWGVDMSTSPNTLVVRQSAGLTLTSPSDWGSPTVCAITGTVKNEAGADQEPWHVEVRKFGGQYIGLLTVGDNGTSGTNAQIQVIVSTDGTNWTGGTQSCIPQINVNLHNRLYRATFAPEYDNGELVLRCWYSAVWMPPSGSSQWNIFRTALRGVGVGGVSVIPAGDPVPAGIPGGRILMRTAAAGEVARNYVTNSAPMTLIDYWGFGFNGTGGAATFTRETTGGPPRGSAAWAKKLFTTAPSTNSVYTAFGSNTVDTCAVTANAEWTFSAWLYASYAGSVSSIRVVFYDAAGTAIGSEVLGAYYDQPAGVWVRRTLTCTTPAGAARALIRGYHQNAIPGVGAITGMSSLMAHPGHLVREYHNGALSPDSKLTASWVGTAYASQAILSATGPYTQFWDGAAVVSL